MKRRWSADEIERVRSERFDLTPDPVTRERPGPVVRYIRDDQPLERVTMAQNQNVTVQGAPWMLILQVILVVCWYAVPSMQGLSAWVIFLPTILGLGFLAMFLVLAACVMIAAIIADKMGRRS